MSALPFAEKYITASEHQVLSVGRADVSSGLSSQEAESLLLIASKRPGLCERGYQSIRLAEYAGVVSLGERVLEILPKIDPGQSQEDDRGMLLRLLQCSSDFPLFRDVDVGQRLKHSPLLEIFIVAFLDSVASIVRGGLLHQYIEREDDLTVLRGRIRATRQFAVLANRPDVLACRFDELSANNKWNRIVKNGMRAVGPWISTGHVGRRWSELLSVFDDVADIRISLKEFDRLVFDRHADRYRTAIGWVRWILELLSPSGRAGADAGPGFLVSMNNLFQSAVASILRQTAIGKGTVTVSAQENGVFLSRLSEGEKNAFRVKPDLVFRSQGVCVSIADTKWKRISASQTGYLIPLEPDMYQMHAYASAYACEDLALIYPWHEGLAGSKETTFQLPNIRGFAPRVHVVCINTTVDELTVERGRAFLDRALGFG